MSNSNDSISALEDKHWFQRMATVTLVARFIGFWAAVALVLWFIGWITLPSWLVWVLAAFALFTVLYSAIYSVAVHRAQMPDEPAGAFYTAIVAVWAVWIAGFALVVFLLWWWLG